MARRIASHPTPTQTPRHRQPTATRRIRQPSWLPRRPTQTRQTSGPPPKVHHHPPPPRLVFPFRPFPPLATTPTPSTASRKERQSTNPLEYLNVRTRSSHISKNSIKILRRLVLPGAQRWQARRTCLRQQQRNLQSSRPPARRHLYKRAGRRHARGMGRHARKAADAAAQFQHIHG